MSGIGQAAGGFINLVTGIIAGIVILVVVIILIRLCYKKVPPNQAFIISGLHKKPRLVSGRATFTIPIVQRIDKLNLGLIQSNIVTSAPVPTADFIEVSVSAVVNFQISADQEQLERAQRNFLNFSKADISKIASEVLEGSMREIIGQMFIKDMVTDRETFNARVIQTAKPDLNNMGLDLISFNVQNFQDERGVIEKLGMDQTAQITRDAAIAKIEADREVELKNAEARNTTNERNTQTDRSIAEREQELAVMRAQLQIEQDTKKAEADLAYQIQTETKSRELEIAKQEAAIAKQEKEIELKEREVQITERQLEAEIKKKAEADRYAKEQAAEAALFEVQKRAESEKSQADADRYKVEASAQAQAELGKSEASVIQAKGEAEARSQELRGVAIANALKEQAEAYNDMQNSFVLMEKYIEALPLIAQAIAEPLAKVGNITMYGEGNIANLVEETTRTTTQINEAMSESLGFDIQGLLNGAITGRAIGNGIRSASPDSQEEQPGSPQLASGQQGTTRGAHTRNSNRRSNNKRRNENQKPESRQNEGSAALPDASQTPDITKTPQTTFPIQKTEDELAAEALGDRFEGDIIKAENESDKKNQLANSMTEVYARAKNMVFDPATTERVQDAVLTALNEVDISTLQSKEDVSRFLMSTLIPKMNEKL